MTKSQRNLLLTRLLRIGVPKRITTQLVNQIEKWYVNSGPEWTIQRLKSLRQSYLRFLAGDSYELANFANKVHDGTLIPKGVWGYFWTKDSNRVPVSLAVFHTYTVFTLKHVTPNQSHKFLVSCMSKDQPVLSIDLLRSVRNYGDKLSFQSRPYRRSLTASVNALSPNHRRKFPRDFSKAVDLIYQDELDLTDMYSRWGGFERWFSKTNPGPSDGLVGNLGITQERGGKLRVFAFPNLLFQVMLNPMKASLLRILKRIPEDCTHNQEAGVEWVRTQMQMGRKVHSVDLSDATNYFPFDIQRALLESIFRHREWENHLQLFEYVSKGKYGAKALGLPHVHWTVGQPLGTGPSFPAFAIAHHAVLHFCKDVVGKTGVDCYRILGDDIVISDESVYRQYRNVLASLKCPVSEPKTFSSMELAEFGGMLVYKGMVIPSTKWSDDHLGNITNVAWLERERALSVLPRSWKETYMIWYSTFVHNSLGLPKDDRLRHEASVYLYQEKKRAEREKKLKRMTFQRLYYSIISDVEFNFDSADESTPDQDVRIVLEPYGFSNITLPVATFAAKFGTHSYQSEVDLRVKFHTGGLGRLRSFRDAIRSFEQ